MLYVLYGQRPYALPVVGGLFSSPTPTAIMTNTPMVTLTVSDLFITSTPRFTPAYVLPPTLTPENLVNPLNFPFIVDRGNFYRNLNRVLFSYYYPDLGGVNCHEDNWVDGHCKNVTASKVVGWREYMGSGVAVHSDMLQYLPYGTQFYVTNPPAIAGFYTVVDLCCGCKHDTSYYFDFLFDNMPDGVNWSYNVDYYVSRIGWDGSIPPSTATVICPPPVPTLAVTLTSVSTQTPYVITATFQPSFTPTFLALDTPVPSFTVTPTP